jgi:hypothetical protein
MPRTAVSAFVRQQCKQPLTHPELQGRSAAGLQGRRAAVQLLPAAVPLPAAAAVPLLSSAGLSSAQQCSAQEQGVCGRVWWHE